MQIVKYDKEFEELKRLLESEAIEIIGLRHNKIFKSVEDMGTYLVSIDPLIISKLSVKPMNEFLMEVDDASARLLQRYRHQAKIWLCTEGFKILVGKYTVKEVSWMEKFRLLWMNYMLESLGAKSEVYYKPSLLMWSFYLTIRQEIPKEFPSNLPYMYTMSRWSALICKLDDMDLLDVGSDEEKRKKVTHRILREWKTESETALKKLDGTYTPKRRCEEDKDKKKAMGHPELDRLFSQVAKLQKQGTRVVIEEAK